MKSRPYSFIIFLALTTAMFTSCSVPEHQLHEPITPTATKPPIATKTIVFIHGMFTNSQAWDQWQTYFQEKGYKTYAPDWPGHQLSPAEMRKQHPDSDLGQLTLEEVVDSYRKFLDTLSEKPILVGHSMGGLVTQILLAEGRAAAGIAVNSAPPKGLISLKWSFLQSNWPVISPFAEENEAVLLSPEQFAYAFTNCLPEKERKDIYSSYASPESRKVGKGTLTDMAAVDYSKKKEPLLILAGGEDHIIPAGLNFKNFEEYEESPSYTEFKLFPGRCHWTLGQAGWQNVAGYVFDWLEGRSDSKNVTGMAH